MIGVLAKPGQEAIVAEFFELFKTPWEHYRRGNRYDVVVTTVDDVPEASEALIVVYGPGQKNSDKCPCTLGKASPKVHTITFHGDEVPIYGAHGGFELGTGQTACITAGSTVIGVRSTQGKRKIVRVGFDLFAEVATLLTMGQPREYAQVPTLDIHIAMLREWILWAGVQLLEIPPVPAGRKFAVCLTHDVDFVGIRNHFFDHTMWGFVYRGTFGVMTRWVKGKLPLSKVLKSWLAVASLPFVYLGWVPDFWEPFGWYLETESGLPATYFFIPFKGRSGDRVPGAHPSRRAAGYALHDLKDQIAVLRERGCEVGVHGIDAWHDGEKGRQERAALAETAGEQSRGIRMHWLLQEEGACTVLEKSGFAYDSTCGYNETVGYRAGTGQVFRPLGCQSLLEIPMHIQDGALFYPQRLNLSESEAEERCQTLIENARRFGGVLTLLWHDRSHRPERFWGEFYANLVGKLRSLGCWFGSAADVVDWFRMRRSVQFAGMGEDRQFRLRHSGAPIDPPLTVRIHTPRGSDDCADATAGPTYVDIPWNGTAAEEFEERLLSNSYAAATHCA